MNGITLNVCDLLRYLSVGELDLHIAVTTEKGVFGVIMYIVDACDTHFEGRHVIAMNTMARYDNEPITGGSMKVTTAVV